MALTPADVARLAALARIEMSDDECAALAPQLDIVLEAVARVSHVADQDIAPTSHAVPLTNVFRDDVVKPSYAPEVMLAMAPSEEDGRFRVPRILEEEA